VEVRWAAEEVLAAAADLLLLGLLRDLGELLREEALENGLRDRGGHQVAERVAERLARCREEERQPEGKDGASEDA